MPRKVRQLKADLRKAEFVWRPGKGSHTVWTHSLLPADSMTLSGNDGDDAQPFQEKDVRRILNELWEAQRRQP
jgi:hypothetical protein